MYSLIIGLLCLLGAPQQDTVKHSVCMEVHCDTVYTDPFLRTIDSISKEVVIGIPSEVVVAVAWFETRGGQSSLFKKSNNAFSIKCWGCKDATIAKDETYLPPQAFKNYSSLRESVEDFNRLMHTNRYKHLLGNSSFRDWAYGLSKAGYATNPKYPSLLLSFNGKSKVDITCDSTINYLHAGGD